MTFSGSILEITDVVSAVLDVALPTGRPEIWLPWSRGFLAGVGDLGWDLPIMDLVEKRLQVEGRAKQNAYTGSR